MKIKDEDLDDTKIHIARTDQEVLDAAFLGYVRINVVHPDPTVETRSKVINDRPLDTKHKKNITVSLHDRKADWDHTMHMLVDGSKVDPACFTRSPFPIKDMKPLVWTCPPAERVVEFLSGNHRRESTTQYHLELLEEKGTMEAKLAYHLRTTAAKGGQKQIKAGGELGDLIEDKLKAKIAKLGTAALEACMWTQKAYDTRKAFQEARSCYY